MSTFSINRFGRILIFVSVISFVLFWYMENYYENKTKSSGISVGKLLALSVSLAETSGKIIWDVYKSSKLDIHKKNVKIGSLKELLTRADIASNQNIYSGLRLYSDKIQIVSEEKFSVESNVEKTTLLTDLKLLTTLHRDILLSDDQITMWIDPLDATQEFTEGLIQYVTVMICAAFKGVPLFGVIHSVFSNTTYWALSSEQLSPSLQPFIRKDDDHANNKSLKIIVSRSHNSPKMNEKIREAFAPKNIELIPAGGSGYKVLSLVKGEADIYLHPSGARKWDLCAPTAVLEAVGGVMGSLREEAFSFAGTSADSPMLKAGIFAARSQHLARESSSALAKLRHSLKP